MSYNPSNTRGVEHNSYRSQSQFSKKYVESDFETGSCYLRVELLNCMLLNRLGVTDT